MVMDDYIQEETMMEYDKDNPSMDVGAIYPFYGRFSTGCEAIRNK